MEKITLRAKDRTKFEVDPRILAEAECGYLASGCVYSVDGITLEKVIQWCQYCFNNPKFSKKGLKKKVGARRAAWRREKMQLESSILDVNPALLVKMMEGALSLSIGSLLSASCEKAASLLVDGSLESVVDLPKAIQSRIAEHLLPNALKKQVESGKIQLTYNVKKHNRIWTSIFQNDAWFEAALDLEDEVNPVLIGKDLGRDCQYLVLNSTDTSGQLQHRKDVRLKDSLHPHMFDAETCECTMEGSKTMLNIWDIIHWGRGSIVPDLADRLLETRYQGHRPSTQVLYLKSAEIYDYYSKGYQGRGQLKVDCSRVYWPDYDSRKLHIHCFDQKEVVEDPEILSLVLNKGSFQGYD